MLLARKQLPSRLAVLGKICGIPLPMGKSMQLWSALTVPLKDRSEQ